MIAVVIVLIGALAGQTELMLTKDGSGDVLTVERQLSVAVQPEPDRAGVQSLGRLVEMENPANNRQTIVYGRKS
jgi:hypothetical protein